MKGALLLTVCVSLAALVNGQISYSVAVIPEGKPVVCTDSKTNKTYKPGEHWDNGCSRNYCKLGEPANVAVTHTEGCDLHPPMERCCFVTKYRQDVPYPRCCPTVKCSDELDQDTDY